MLKQDYADVQISAIFNDETMSLSGCGSSLRSIKTYLKAHSVECRWAHVHALYHRGLEMKKAMEATICDAERRKISFPSWKALHSPIRSVADGKLMSPTPSLPPGSGSPLEEALHSIFIEKVNWRGASTNMRASIRDRLQGDSSASYRVVGIGTGSRSLLHSFRVDPLHPRLRVVDNLAESLSLPAQDDNAVVGLSVNFPGAKGQEQFWQLLTKGVNTVTGVRGAQILVDV